jgi:hypothetical protein
MKESVQPAYSMLLHHRVELTWSIRKILDYIPINDYLANKQPTQSRPLRTPSPCKLQVNQWGANQGENYLYIRGDEAAAIGWLDTLFSLYALDVADQYKMQGRNKKLLRI